MSSVCVDRGVMWRLSDDFNRRFAARVHHQSHHAHSHHHHRSSAMAMIYNGRLFLNPFHPKENWSLRKIVRGPSKKSAYSKSLKFKEKSFSSEFSNIKFLKMEMQWTVVVLSFFFYFRGEKR